MSLGETRAILQDLFQQFQQAEELSLLKSISETKQKTNQYCQHSLSKARNQVSGTYWYCSLVAISSN
jgi:hypothetical protein